MNYFRVVTTGDQASKEISMAKLRGGGFCPVVPNDRRFGYLERAEKRQRTAAVQNLAEIPRRSILARARRAGTMERRQMGKIAVRKVAEVGKSYLKLLKVGCEKNFKNARASADFLSGSTPSPPYFGGPWHGWP